MDVWTKTTLKSLLTPGGWLLLAMVVLLHAGFITLPLPVVTYFYYAALIIGLLLAWRFHASRIFLALLVVFLAERALAFFSGGHMPVNGPGHTALEVLSFLLPLNFVLLSLGRERGFTWSSIAPAGILLFVESVAVAVLCRPGQWQGAATLSSRAVHQVVNAPPLAPVSLLAFAAATVVLLVRFLLFRKPVENALLWGLSTSFLALYFGGVGRIPTAYFGVSALILGVSIVENSYHLAYQDELTSLPSRRAFNEALLRLESPYSVAIVDIDHFKSFNDTYGHDTGDQVLRVVAAKLAGVTGGGQAYRCGGEEFAILFSGKSTKEVVGHLEELRITIGNAKLHMRGADRRQDPRGPERRNQRVRGRGTTARAIRRLAQVGEPRSLSVTVSIGVASATEKTQAVEQIVQAADKALYRAKADGRNRVEASSAARGRARAKAARSIA